MAMFYKFNHAKSVGKLGHPHVLYSVLGTWILRSQAEQGLYKFLTYWGIPCWMILLFDEKLPRTQLGFKFSLGNWVCVTEWDDEVHHPMLQTKASKKRQCLEQAIEEEEGYLSDEMGQCCHPEFTLTMMFSLL